MLESVIALKTYLDMSLDVCQRGKIEVNDILEEVYSFLIASHEATTMAIGWTLLPCLRSEVQGKLYNSIKAHDTKTGMFEKYGNIQYLEMVIKESLRMQTPAPFVARHELYRMTPLLRKALKSESAWVLSITTLRVRA